jgi:phage shock protein PspC (stress-responsive transcriptional regulator)
MANLPSGWQNPLHNSSPSDFWAMFCWHGTCIFILVLTGEHHMSSENVINELRESLNGRPGQPIVFGVCKSLADRFDKEPWVFRLAAILITLFWPLAGLAAYIIAGLVMQETEDRTRKFFAGLMIIVREQVEKGAACLRGCCQTSAGSRHRSNGY